MHCTQLDTIKRNINLRIYGYKITYECIKRCIKEAY